MYTYCDQTCQNNLNLYSEYKKEIEFRIRIQILLFKSIEIELLINSILNI